MVSPVLVTSHTFCVSCGWKRENEMGKKEKEDYYIHCFNQLVRLKSLKPCQNNFTLHIQNFSGMGILMQKTKL